MKYTVQYNRDGHPTQSRMHTNNWNRASAFYEKCKADPAVTNLEMFERDEA